MDDDNRELSDEIEEVNLRMLSKLIESKTFVAVLFCENSIPRTYTTEQLLKLPLSLDDNDCLDCDSILEALEKIDYEADTFGIDFVKINDPLAAIQYQIFNTPALVYFRQTVRHVP